MDENTFIDEYSKIILFSGELAKKYFYDYLPQKSREDILKILNHFKEGGISYEGCDYKNRNIHFATVSYKYIVPSEFVDFDKIEASEEAFDRWHITNLIQKSHVGMESICITEIALHGKDEKRHCIDGSGCADIPCQHAEYAQDLDYKALKLIKKKEMKRLKNNIFQKVIVNGFDIYLLNPD